MAKRRLDEIVLLRALAIFTVVGIHFLNIPVQCLDESIVARDYYTIFQALLNFAVPCFIFISGLMISYNQPQGKLPIKSFYARKLQKIGVPYLFWTFMYLIFLYLINALEVSDLANPQNWVTWLLLGKTYEHLYFFIIIFEFYLISPLLLPVAQKLANSLPKALLFGFGIQLIMYWLNRLYFYDVFPFITRTILWYWFIGFMGLWLGANYQHNSEKLKQYKLPMIILCILTAIIRCTYEWLIIAGVRFDTFFYTCNMWINHLSVACVLLLFCIYLSTHINKYLNRFLAWIGNCSFGIYLIHPAFTYVIMHYARMANIQNPLIWLPITLFGIFALSAFCGVLVSIMNKSRILGLTLGKWPKKQTPAKN